MGRLRLFLWRFRVPLALGYLMCLGGLGFGLWFYLYRVPASVDTGLTVAARAVFWNETFREVERARADFDRGTAELDAAARKRHWDRVEQRLELFLARHPKVQPDRLHTHAIVAATELLAELHRERGKHKRAAKLLGRLADEIPLNYRLRRLEAAALDAAGDARGAIDAYRRAFKLALNHPDLVEDYLEVLAELNEFTDIVWVADHFDRAVKRGRPSVEVKVGAARGALQRRVLEWCGIPVEHGSYTRSVTLYNLERGAGQVLAPPVDLLEGWASGGGSLYVQLRFENIYDELKIESFRYWTRDGERHEVALDASNLSMFHRAHSGVEYYAEVRTALEPADVARFEVVYGCAEYELNKSARAIIAKARANAEAKPR